jgi:hypothetical protein
MNNSINVKNSLKNDEKIEKLENLYNQLFNILNTNNFDKEILEEANKINKQIAKIDSGIAHDVNNIILTIRMCSIKIKGNNPKNNIDKNKKLLKEQIQNLNNLLYGKEYDTTEIMKDVLKISKLLNININLNL